MVTQLKPLALRTRPLHAAKSNLGPRARRRLTSRARSLAVFSGTLGLLTVLLHAARGRARGGGAAEEAGARDAGVRAAARQYDLTAANASLTKFATAVLHARPATPGALTVAYTPFLANGLGAQLLRLLDAAAVAHIARPHAALCVDEPRYWNYGCAPYKGWSCYWRPRPCPSLRRCTELSALRAPEAFWRAACVRVSRNASARVAEALHGALDRHRRAGAPATLSRALMTPLWQFGAATGAHVRAHAEALRLRRGAYVGVHVRRGDKARESAPVPVARYAAAVRVIARAKEPVFLASDDGAVLRALRKELPDHAVVALPDLATRKAHVQMRHNRVWMRRRFRMVADTLTELCVLADARVFVGTFSSNFGRLVHVVRHASEQTSVSLDDAWEPGVAWHTFGKPYCSSAAANKEFCRAWESPY